MSFDPESKGKKVFADDGMSERVIGNFRTCLIINMLKRGSKETCRLLVTRVSCRISFKVDKYRSHFEISIIAPKNEKVHEHKQCYQLSMRYDHQKLCAENLEVAWIQQR